VKILYFDCFNGASGDMVLGALLDAGLPLEELRRALGSLAIEGASVSSTKVLRAGVSATKLHVAEYEGAETGHRHNADHGHGHHHHGPAAVAHQHSHRTLAEINRLIGQSSLPAAAQLRARDLFQRLGEAEAAIHQMPIETIHLHEVGALDSIIDIVGAVFALEWFGADRVISSPLNVGGGMVESAHGAFPVPAPATMKLLTGVPVYSSGVQSELVTPTGALLITGYAASYGPVPAMTVETIGYGAGSRDLPGTPNVLRVLVGEGGGQAASERIVVINCEIDDMNPQLFGPLMDRLFEAGALDVFYSAVQMKKNRPGVLVTVLAPPDKRELMASVLFTESTTIGVRFQDVLRERLEREIQRVDTPVGTIRFKIARRDGRILNAAPEFEDCAAAAAARKMSVKDVQAIAMKAWLEQGAQQRA
jgi:pyridinium-3,5-bisthiocarboxylic acid mononucleotide nickel chelatase